MLRSQTVEHVEIFVLHNAYIFQNDEFDEYVDVCIFQKQVEVGDCSCMTECCPNLFVSPWNPH